MKIEIENKKSLDTLNGKENGETTANKVEFNDIDTNIDDLFNKKISENKIEEISKGDKYTSDSIRLLPSSPNELKVFKTEQILEMVKQVRSDLIPNDVPENVKEIIDNSITNLKIVSLVNLSNRLDEEGVFDAISSTLSNIGVEFESKKIKKINIGLAGIGTYKEAEKIYNFAKKQFDIFASIKRDLSEKIRLKALELMKHEFEVGRKMEQAGVPNLIHFYELIYKNEELAGIEMEYCGGGDLKKQFDKPLKDRSPEDTKKVYEQLWHAAVSIQTMHENDFVHLDIKPANLFLTSDGEVRVADLAFAKELDEKCIVCGSPAYMAPELCARVAKKNTTAQDTWSFGAMLYLYATGAHLINHKIEKGKEIEAYKKFKNNVKWDAIKPDELREAIQGLLVLNPELRKPISSVVEVLKQLSI